jgi:uncharacterized protein YbcI
MRGVRRRVEESEVTTLRCRVFRGLVKEAEEEINKFLSTHVLHLLHMAQSESGDHISVTLIYQELDPLSDRGL